MPPHVTMDRPPIRPAKFFESLLCRRRFTLCLEHHAPVRGSKDRRINHGLVARAQRRQRMFRRRHIKMQTNDGTKGKLGLIWAQICFELRLKSITMEFNFFGECFLYDSPLLLIEDFLIWPPVCAIFRFRCDTEGAIKRNVKLSKNIT